VAQGGTDEEIGLGLAVVRAIVEAHGGWIDVQTRPDQGLVVDLFLPLAAQAGAPRLESANPTVRTETPEATSPPAVLILEDDPLLGRLVEQILLRNGFRTELARAPAEAERRWQRFNGTLDLAIVERELAGGRSGVDLIRRWRREFPGLRAVLLDRRASPTDPDWSPSLEGLPVLRRPFDPSDVLRRVKEELATQERTSAREEFPSVAESSGPPSDSAEPTGRMLAH
jgi:CheY-like chemotaxis protein